MAYLSATSLINLNQNTLEGDPNSPEDFKEAYSAYEPNPLKSIELTDSDWWIVPELYAPLVASIAVAKRAIWWLSVDWFQSSHPQLLYPSILRQFLQQDNLVHLYQSNYAKEFLLSNGARTLHPLFDYTTDSLRMEQSDRYLQNKTVDFSFFPRKGGNLAQQFIQASQNTFSHLAIQDMTQVQVKTTLAQSRIYIDFGHHPGKDRVPREAACMANIIFLHDQGSARFYEDHPLNPWYLFTSSDLLNGTLHSKVSAVLEDPIKHFQMQAFYRHRIQLEKEEFDLQVKTIFGVC